MDGADAEQEMEEGETAGLQQGAIGTPCGSGGCPRASISRSSSRDDADGLRQ